MASAYNRPISDIFSDLVGQLATLVRKEGQLARSEMSEKINVLLTGLVMIVGGAVLLIPALVLLSQAVVAALVASGMTVAVASLLVGGIALIAGAALVLIGRGMIKPGTLVPDKTIEQLGRDAAMAKRTATASDTWDEQHGPKAMRPTQQEASNGYDPQRAA